MPNASTIRELKLPRRSQKPRQVDRRQRFPALLGAPRDATAVVDGLRVAVVGVGGVGRNIALHLARLGIRSLLLVDPKCYTRQSILCQSIAPRDIGRNKAIATGALCKSISPRTHVFACPAGIEQLGLAPFAEIDMVCLASDNLPAEVEVAQRCLHNGKPLVNAAIFGATLTAQVRVLTHARATDPCLACLFNRAEWDLLNNGVLFSCDGARLPVPRMKIVSQPTLSISPLCSLAADMAVMQLLRLALGLGKSVANTLLDYSAYSHKTVTSQLTRNPHCPCDHTIFETREVRKPLRDCSVKQLAEAAGLAARLAEVSVLVDDLQWASQGRCSCSHSQTVAKWVDPRQRVLGRCRKCDRPLAPQPFYLHRPVPMHCLSANISRPLRTMGASRPQCVLVRGGNRGVLFRNP